MAAFWDIAFVSLVKVDRRFAGAYYRALWWAVSTSETSVKFYQTAHCGVPECVLTTARTRNLSVHIISYTEWKLFPSPGVWRGCLRAGGHSLIFSPARESERVFLAASVAPCHYWQSQHSGQTALRLSSVPTVLRCGSVAPVRVDISLVPHAAEISHPRTVRCKTLKHSVCEHRNCSYIGGKSAVKLWRVKCWYITGHVSYMLCVGGDVRFGTRNSVIKCVFSIVRFLELQNSN